MNPFRNTRFLVLACLLVLFPVSAQESVQTGDLAEQLARGGEITLEAGEFSLETITITSDTRLIGAGRDKTIIRLSGATAGLSVRDAAVQISGISFVHDGGVGANVAVFESSILTLNDCAFSGARMPDPENTVDVGAGAIFIHSQGTVTNCMFKDNVTGVVVGRESMLSFERIEVSDNLEDGLLAVVNAYVVLEWSHVANNGFHGVYAKSDAYLRLSRNTVEKNGGAGVYLNENASGVVIGSLLRKNKYFGLLIEGTGQAWIDNAQAHGNNIGFGFSGEARAYLKRTDAVENALGYHGLGQSVVEIEGAFASYNEEHGFSFAEGARATLKNNTSEANSLNGFALRDDAQASFELNLAADNVKSGFFFTDGSKATMQGNVAEQNGAHGVLAAHSVGLELNDNQLLGNTGYGLFVAEDNGVELSAAGNTFSTNAAGAANVEVAENP